MSRIYIAAQFSRRPLANHLANLLKAHGHVITSRWVLPHTDHVLPTGMSAQAADAELQRFAIEYIADLQQAEWLVSLQEPRSNGRDGRHVEFGYAVALGIRITVIGPRVSVFHHLPTVEHFETVDEFLGSIDVGVYPKQEG